MTEASTYLQFYGVSILGATAGNLALTSLGEEAFCLWVSLEARHPGTTLKTLELVSVFDDAGPYASKYIRDVANLALTMGEAIYSQIEEVSSGYKK